MVRLYGTLTYYISYEVSDLSPTLALWEADGKCISELLKTGYETTLVDLMGNEIINVMIEDYDFEWVELEDDTGLVWNVKDEVRKGLLMNDADRKIIEGDDNE
ncbi:hypothetical protein ACI2JA_04145 [Alkalihalobacillus sp. NPDC078783]